MDCDSSVCELQGVFLFLFLYYVEKPSDYCGHAKGVRTGKDAVGTACRRRRKSMAAEELAWEEQPVCSYQQISCLDSVIR